MAISNELQDFIDQSLLPAVFERAPELFAEFGFRETSKGWISTTTTKLDGSEGDSKGKVALLADRPYCLCDFRTPPKNVIKYVQDRDGHHNWITAVKALAESVGLQVPGNSSPEQLERQKRRDRAAEIHEAANDFFIGNLSDPDSPTAKTAEATAHRDHLLNTRRYGPYLRKHFKEYDHSKPVMELGFIPSISALREHLVGKGFKQEEVSSLLLDADPEGGGVGPWPRSIGDIYRLSLPKRDPSGRILTFIFRTITDASPKYMAPAGEWKQRYLYNLRSVRNDGDLIVVEGQLDALHATVLGIPNVVALGGKNITDKQVETAKKYGAKKITLCVDGDVDPAHINSLSKVIKRHGLKVFVARLQADKDPDELLREEGGVDTFRSLIKKAVTAIEFESDSLIRPAKTLFDKFGEIDSKDREAIVDKLLEIECSTASDKDLLISKITNEGAFLKISKETLDARYTQNIKEQAEKAKQEAVAKQLSAAVEYAEAGKLSDAIRIAGRVGQEDHSESLEAIVDDFLKPNSLFQLRENLKNKLDGIPTGLFIGTEELTLPPGAITMIAAPTSHGKTTILISLALRAQQRSGLPAYFFSYEEDADAINVKALNCHLDREISSNNKRSLKSFLKHDNAEFISRDVDIDKLTADIMRFFSNTVETGLFTVKYTGIDTNALVSAIRKLKEANKVGIVFIDYIQLLHMTGCIASSRQEELKQICLKLKDCAIETGLPLVLGAQFNREVSGISSLSTRRIGEAGDIERVSNQTIGVWNLNFRQDDDDSIPRENALHVTYLKHRDGQASVEGKWAFDGNLGRIANITDQVAPVKKQFKNSFNDIDD